MVKFDFFNSEKKLQYYIFIKTPQQPPLILIKTKVEHYASLSELRTIVLELVMNNVLN